MNGVIVKNLSKVFDEASPAMPRNPGGKLVLDSFSAFFAPSGCYGLMAPSGAGKTTLFRILLGLEKPSSGSVEGLTGLKMTAVFQEDRLCEAFSPIDNILMVLGKDSLLSLPSSHIREAVSRELSRLLPEDCLNQPVSSLSGGMKRRVSVCRSLVVPSDFIIMDEPFSGLDEETKRGTAQYILEKRKGRTLLFSTHQEKDIFLMGAKLITL